MGGQILVHGFLEMPCGSEAENEATLDRLRKDSSHYFSLATAIEPSRKGFLASTCAFAKSLKETAESDCFQIQSEFENLLMALKLESAHLSIYHPNRDVDLSIDYACGSSRVGGKKAWFKSSYQKSLVEENVIAKADGSAG